MHLAGRLVWDFIFQIRVFWNFFAWFGIKLFGLGFWDFFGIICPLQNRPLIFPKITAFKVKFLKNV